MSIHGIILGPDGKPEPRRYLCERCGGTGHQEAGCWDGKAYAAPAGLCDDCGGTGYLGLIEPRDNPKYLPTTADIAAGCDKIQKDWTPREKAKRCASVEPYTVPTVSVGEVD